MRRRIVVTGGGDQHAEMATRTVPTLEAYAKRIGADFRRLHDSELARPDIHRWWIKTKMRELFGAYDDVAWIDIDCVVAPRCPDLFEFAGGSLAWFPESDLLDRCDWFREYCRIMVGEVPAGWDGRYYNGGVIVIPGEFADVVRLPDDPELEKAEAMIRTHPKTFWSDQNWFNLQAARFGLKPKALPLRLNYMPFEELWDRRLGADIIHYAGLLNCQGPKLYPVIEHDLRKWSSWEEERREYERKQGKDPAQE